MAKLPPPSLRFLFARPAHFIACGFGSGLSPFAPGTAGTLFAWASYWPLRYLMPSDGLFAWFLLVAFAIGIWACHRTGQALGIVDHGAIVWDEVVPFWTVLALTPVGLGWQLAAFLLFRGFDIVKLPPAGHFDQRVKNGFGVMMDDTAAAGHTLLALAVARLVLA